MWPQRNTDSFVERKTSHRSKLMKLVLFFPKILRSSPHRHCFSSGLLSISENTFSITILLLTFECGVRGERVTRFTHVASCRPDRNCSLPFFCLFFSSEKNWGSVSGFVLHFSLYSVWQVRFLSFFSSAISEFVWQTRNSRRSPQVCIVWKTDPIWILSLFVKCTRNYLFFAQCTSKFTRAEYWIKRSVLRYRYQTEAGSARKEQDRTFRN